MSHALRHEPWVYELELDSEGWTPVDSLVAALQKERDDWQTVSSADLQRVIDTSSKKRFEIVGDRIRAIYGHSIPAKLSRVESVPPAILYHGTSPQAISAILTTGLLPMARQYVHLSIDVATAREVGRRKSRQPVLLQIDTLAAVQAGVKFYLGHEKVWLADLVPAQFLTTLGS